MRLFQNSGIYKGYIPRLRQLTKDAHTFSAIIAAFLDDRYGAPHFLKPVLDRDPDAFFTNGDDEVSQRAWARENGLKGNASLEDILLAQIEAHRSEIFYNLDPLRYGSAFIRRLPASVKRSFAWRAAPSPNADFEAYDLILGNFPSILTAWRERGWRSAYFAPGHDPELESSARNEARPIDILFVGGYSRHHKRRAQILEAVASLNGQFNVRFHLDHSRLTRVAETALGLVGPLREHRRPDAIRDASAPPVFGRELYAALGLAKIVLNGAIDMAGDDRGNMRCWEALGARALMLSDTGVYPAGMTAGKTFVEFETGSDAAALCVQMLAQPEELLRIADAGHRMIATAYSKQAQWVAFQELCG